MTPKERAAMQQALEVLKGLKTASSIMNDGPDDSDVNHAEYIAAEAWSKASEAITALREALAEPDIEEMTLTQIAARHEQAEQEPLMITPGGGAFPFAVVGELEQAEQEPVAWMNTNGAVNKLREAGWAMNAAPIRTKDLTDDDQMSLDETIMVGMANYIDKLGGDSKGFRAVIAAYKEKNK